MSPFEKACIALLLEQDALFDTTPQDLLGDFNYIEQQNIQGYSPSHLQNFMATVTSYFSQDFAKEFIKLHGAQCQRNKEYVSSKMLTKV